MKSMSKASFQLYLYLTVWFHWTIKNLISGRFGTRMTGRVRIGIGGRFTQEYAIIKIIVIFEASK